MKTQIKPANLILPAAALACCIAAFGVLYPHSLRQVFGAPNVVFGSIFAVLPAHRSYPFSDAPPLWGSTIWPMENYEASRPEGLIPLPEDIVLPESAKRAYYWLSADGEPYAYASMASFHLEKNPAGAKRLLDLGFVTGSPEAARMLAAIYASEGRGYEAKVMEAIAAKRGDILASMTRLENQVFGGLDLALQEGDDPHPQWGHPERYRGVQDALLERLWSVEPRQNTDLRMQALHGFRLLFGFHNTPEVKLPLAWTNAQKKYDLPEMPSGEITQEKIAVAILYDAALEGDPLALRVMEKYRRQTLEMKNATNNATKK